MAAKAAIFVFFALLVLIDRESFLSLSSQSATCCLSRANAADRPADRRELPSTCVAFDGVGGQRLFASHYESLC